MMPFSISKSTRLESMVSKRSISSVASLLTLAFFIFSTFCQIALLGEPIHNDVTESITVAIPKIR